MSSAEVKLSCVEPDRLCVVPSVACNVICSVLGNARITLGSKLTRSWAANVCRNLHGLFLPCQLPKQYMFVGDHTLNCFTPVAHFKSRLLCLEPDRLCFLHPCVLHMMWSECENGMLTS